MERELYSVEIIEGCRYFVLAFSREHAIVEVCKDLPDIDPSEIDLKESKKISMNEAEEIIIDYIYPENNLNGRSVELSYLVENIDDIVEDNYKEFYGIVGDDFIVY